MSNALRSAAHVQSLLRELHAARRPLRVMEVCGTHTMSIGRWGLRKLLPPWLELLSGPGCPVCVTPVSFFDALWMLPQEVAIAAFGDLLRVAGSHGTLEDARAQGRDVHLVHSPRQALALARQRPTVFAAVGFETTAPGIADVIRQAHEENVRDFSVLCGCKLIAPAMRALLDAGAELDGFLLPGHVASVTGMGAFEFLPRAYSASGVVAGFEPVDILAALVLLARMEQPAIRNAYPRCVKPEGNTHAMRLMQQVFAPASAEWRGLGAIPASGLALRQAYAHLDAAKRYNLEPTPSPEPQGCRCGEVLQGRIRPPDCGLFGSRCTPANPIGPCMVSGEGSCAAWFRYERHA